MGALRSHATGQSGTMDRLPGEPPEKDASRVFHSNFIYLGWEMLCSVGMAKEKEWLL